MAPSAEERATVADWIVASCPADGAGMKDLGTLGGPKSRAHDINNAGQVVGSADLVDNGVVCSHAFVYSGGKMRDLNSLVDPAAGWSLLVATAINDSGQIAGYGTTPDGNTRAFLLTPTSKQEATNH